MLHGPCGQPQSTLSAGGAGGASSHADPIHVLHGRVGRAQIRPHVRHDGDAGYAGDDD